MQWLSVWVLVTCVYNGGGVTKTSGIDQFWTDDYKVFDQIYGKTSDLDIYGDTLPASISFPSLKNQAAEKKEKYHLDDDKDLSTLESIHHDFGNDKAKKPASSYNFISYNDFKPISNENDPDTYNYLRHLEDYELEQKKKKSNKPSYSGFKPYSNTGNPEDTDGYKSIQDILDAHEAKVSKTNKGNGAKYISGKDKRNKPPRFRGSSTPYKQRCLSGRCRKRNNVRVTRPYVRIKHRYI